ncbi:MAG: TRAP transporter small permease [Thermodesulfobacteriota bacterium]|nr:TRAP transporter small permease [Thermodesulfobacteriota bacterium]
MKHSNHGIAFFERITRVLNHVLVCIAGCFLGAMVLLTCANIFFRLPWTIGMPISGAFELMGYFGAVAMAFSLAFTQTRKGHIAVDILVLGFSRRPRQILNSINDVLCMVFFGAVSWQITRYGITLLDTGEVTETLGIIYYPFTFCVALGCAAIALVFLTDLLRSLFSKEDDK